MAQAPHKIDLTPPVDERDHAQGREDASLTPVQYGDYEGCYDLETLLAALTAE